nr:MAG TPA: hypothetical protein [Caudoviricetes sp.]
MPETLLKSTFSAILQGFPTFHFHYSNFNENLQESFVYAGFRISFVTNM